MSSAACPLELGETDMPMDAPLRSTIEQYLVGGIGLSVEIEPDKGFPRSGGQSRQDPLPIQGLCQIAGRHKKTYGSPVATGLVGPEHHSLQEPA